MSRLIPARAVRPQRPGAPGESCARNGDETYCVSSVLKPQFGNSYGAQNLFDGASAAAHGSRARRAMASANGSRSSSRACAPLRPITRAQRLPEEQRHLRKEQPRAAVARDVLARRDPDVHAAGSIAARNRLDAAQTGQGLLGQVHHRRCLGRQQIHGYRDHEAGGQFGAGAVIRATPGSEHPWADSACGASGGELSREHRRAGAKAAGRFRLSARRRSDHHPGYPLRRLEQFCWPSAAGGMRPPNAW